MISIVIPALNAAETLDATLGAIAAQCSGSEVDVEVIVADNGSTDNTCGIVDNWRDRLPVRIVDASARCYQAAARNIGARQARGDLLVFTDADDAVMPGWLAAWCRLDPAVEFATGPVVVFFDADGPPSELRSVAVAPPVQMGFRPYALGTNFAVRRKTFDASGGFDESMSPAEDVELSWRLQLDDVALTFVRDAVVAKRERASTRAVLAQYYSYGLRDPALYRKHRAAGVPRPDVTATLKSYLGLVVRLPLLGHRAQRLKWAHQAGRRAGRLVGSLRTWTLYP